MTWFADLNDRVTLQTVTVADDTETVMTVDTIPAKVVAIGGYERASAGQLGTTMTYRVTVRTRSDLVESCRLVWGTKTLEVNALYDPDGQRRWLVCECTERV